MNIEESIEENREKWLEVLGREDSQKFKAGLESPNNPNQRCCLGHACHALGLEKAVIDGKVRYFGKKTSDAHLLPGSVAEALDITREGMFHGLVELEEIVGIVGRIIVTNRLQFGQLTELNDFTDLTVGEIGKIIEWGLANGKLRNFKGRPEAEVRYAGGWKD